MISPVEQFVRGYDFNISQKESWIVRSIGDAFLYAATCDANLVQNVTMLFNDWVFGLAAKYIHSAAGEVFIADSVGK